MFVMNEQINQLAMLNIITILNAVFTQLGTNTNLLNRNNGHHCVYGFLGAVFILSIYTITVTLKEIKD